MNREDYYAPKHIFGHASQEMSQAVSIEAPAGEAAGDETVQFQHLSALDEADCLIECAVRNVVLPEIMSYFTYSCLELSHAVSA